MAKKRELETKPAGERKTIKQSILETGASLLQDVTPVKQFDIYVVGFHCAKQDPEMQMEAHHYCRQVNGDFLQCVIFDGNTESANLIGIEYIISEQLFETLPEEEKPYWHPHNFEILSGTLVAPGLPDVAEKAMMQTLINSYGKTWHVWHTGRPDGEMCHPLPLGDPMLMWSFNRDGELDQHLLQSRDQGMQIDTFEKRRQRQDLVRYTHPQHGVNTLKDAFTNAVQTPLPGVQDGSDASGTTS